MKKLPKQKKNNRFTIHDLRFDQLGFAPLVLLAISGMFLAMVLVLVATQTINWNGPFGKSEPNSSSQIDAPISTPIPVDIAEVTDCTDEYNADCQGSEGDDVDPADLAGPD